MDSAALLERGASLGVPDPEASPPLDYPGWPGAGRRWPEIGDAGYLALRPLTRDLVRVIKDELAPRGGVRVLDVGCGVKPYLPYFAAVADEYVGVDVVPGPQVDIVTAAETLPFDDGSFDVVLCSQVLEHVTEPLEVLREIHRVLRPNGLALVSTHGTFPYHPEPTDYWRWTQEGLVKIFADTGDYASVELKPCGGTVACFGYIFAWYAKAIFNYRGLARLSRAAVAAINVVFGALDPLVPLHYPRKRSMVSNFLVIARKPAA